MQQSLIFRPLIVMQVWIHYSQVMPPIKIYGRITLFCWYFCCDCFGKQERHRGHILMALLLSSSTFTHCNKLSFSEMKRPIALKLYIILKYDIISATPVSFANQGLSFTYLTCSVEHSQIYVYPLGLAPFLRDKRTFCKDT